MKELKLTDIIKSIGAQCDYSGDIEINGARNHKIYGIIKERNLWK